MFALTILSGALLVSQALAFAPPSNAPLARRASAPAISASDIPPQCQSNCTSFVSLQNNSSCGTADCLCTDAVANACLTCGNCVVAQPGATNDIRSTIQQPLDSLSSLCASAGKPFSTPLQLNNVTRSQSGVLSLTPAGTLGLLGVLAGFFAAAF